MNDMLLSCLLFLFGTFISAVAQVLLKKSAQKTYESLIKEYLNPYVIVGYAISFAATICSVLAYRVVPLSLGPVLESTSYIYVTIFGAAIFKEQITKRKLLALLLIIFGILIYAAGVAMA